MQHSFEEVVRMAATAYQRMQYQFDTQLILPYQVDEIAVLFRTEERLVAFAEWARSVGIDVFNAHVLDTMYRQDAKEKFDIHFEFMRLVDAPFRIEAMCYKGKAPLHMDQLNRYGDGCVMHASFKVQTMQELTAAHDRLLALERLTYTPRAMYRNTYGAFSYWGPWSAMWIKPRINLRDTVVADETSAV